MPNWTNILSPITLIGNGRSGTSLLSQVFKAHPDCTYIGETVNLIQSTYYSIASSLPQSKKGDIPEVIRSMFMHLYPSKEKYWFHKPIGAPIVHSNFKTVDDFCDWYWNVFDLIYPHAPCFTVLRQPYDVIISSVDWWGRPQKSLINSHYIVAKIINHPKSRVNYGVEYTTLMADPEGEVRKLFNYIGIPFKPATLDAFKKNWSVKGHDNGSEVADKVVKNKNTKIERWGEVDQNLITDEFMDVTNQVWRKFDHEVQWKF